MGIARRLFERLEKGIRSLLLQTIRIHDESDFSPAEHRAHLELFFHFADLLDDDFARLGFRLGDVDIRVLHRIAISADDQSSEPLGEFMRAAAIGPAKQIGVSEAVIRLRIFKKGIGFV